MNTLDTTPTVAENVIHDWSMSYSMVPRAVSLMRVHVRRRLLMWAWDGDQEDATVIASELVTNAVRYSRVAGHLLDVRLALLEGGALLIDVSDPVGAFPGFREHLIPSSDDEQGRGLPLIRALGGELSLTLLANGGKTVRAHLPATAAVPEGRSQP
ncbi:ATP-binding protein (plasmid) [Streptomyces sp. Q6]|uniref:ATP-binding protein n=1 Tax=Streptomyces citrinus TaxID=3118173 RepID=A0ACD5AQX1_9ACTN